MLRKLKSGLGSPKGLLLQSALKSALPAFFLYLSPGNWLFSLIFAVLAVYFYFERIFNSSAFLVSFLVLSGFAFIVLSSVSGPNYASYAGLWLFLACLWGILFFLLLGVKNFILMRRRFYYYLLNNLLLFSVLIFFFLGERSLFLFWRYGLVGVIVFFLFREFLVFNNETLPEFRNFPVLAKKNLLALVLSFLVLQFVWGLLFLPIEAWAASLSAFAGVLIFENLLLLYLRGNLSKRKILRNGTALILANLLIFAFASWRA